MEKEKNPGPVDYSRQIKLRQIGLEGQKKIRDAKVAVVGAGALGSAIALYLTKIGVGTITIIDRDLVEKSNLPRQILYTPEDVGKEKALVAEKRLREINPDVIVEGYAQHIDHSTTHLLGGADIVLDGTDNLHTRHLLNQYAVKKQKPWIYGGAIGTVGMTATFTPDGPCFNCIFPYDSNPGTPETCATMGVLGTLPTLIASIQATEAVKLIIGEKPRKTLLYINLWDNTWREISIKKRKNCEVCEKHLYPHLTGEKRLITTSFCEGNRVQITPPVRTSGLVKHLNETAGAEIVDGKAVLREEGLEILIYDDGRAIITGTSDENEAKKIYQKYVSI